MLTMRNGLSLHPAWIPGVLQPMQLPQMGTVFDGGDELLNTNRATNNLSANEETIVKTAFNQSNQWSYLQCQMLAHQKPHLGMNH